MGYIIAFVLGLMIGVVCTALCAAASNGDREYTDEENYGGK